MFKITTTFALALFAFITAGCDADQLDEQVRSGEQVVCGVTEYDEASGEIIETDCYDSSAPLCQARLCCDYSTLGCFCHPSESRCPNGSVKAPCPEGTSC